MRVMEVERESDGVASLVLEPADGAPLAVPLPGQFVVLRLRPRADAPAVLRSYSLSGAPSEERYRVTVKQEPHGVGSGYLLGQVGRGSLLDVSAPRGTFTLRPGTGPVVLLSAGVGATPVLAMLHALVSGRSRREVFWLYGARSGSDHPFAGEARALVRALAHGHLVYRYSRPGPGDRPGVDYDAVGHWDSAALDALPVPLEADFYLCGPTSFLRDLTAALLGRGVTHERIFKEVFGSGDSLSPGIAASGRRPPHPPFGPAGTGPLVSFARAGLTVPWSESYANLLELAEACDVPVKWSCRTGVCHMCESGLVSGAVRYRPEPVDPPADGDLLICCSRPQTEVILDL